MKFIGITGGVGAGKSAVLDYMATKPGVRVMLADEIREARLMESRGYSREKVQQIFSSQLKEAEYRKHCSVVIDNNEGLEEMQRQIDAAVCAI